ncbi:MAG: helix-turn-helix transcriptional regulator [Anaerolineales bacterium]
MVIQNQKLTRREKEVAGLLLLGKSNKQIGQALGISENTVEFHLRNLYVKLKVNSRIEAVLKLGESVGTFEQIPKESVVEIKHGRDDNETNYFLTEAVMKKRLFYYSLAGVIFGMFYWRYLNGAAGFFNQIGNTMDPNAAGGISVWVFVSFIFLVIFGVWLIPTVVPAVHEFHHSARVSHSVLAVIDVWVSAVFGYYLAYFLLLGFFGLPNMEHLLFFGERSSTFWREWGIAFSKLILFPFLKWTIVAITVGGLSGLVTSSIYSFWRKKTTVLLPS